MQKNKKIPGRPVKKGGLSRSGIMLIVLSVALIAVVTALIILLNVRGGEESKPEETTPAVTTPAPEPTEEPTEEPQVSDVDFGSSDYSREFFAKDLFIGDSIATGFNDYSKLNAENVAASVSMTPYKAHAEDIALADGSTGSALSYAEKMQPERIFLMMGFNGLNSPIAMEGSFRTLVEKLESACPNAVIYLYSITPLTANSSAAASIGVDNSNVISFNEYLRGMCGELGVVYLDIFSKMTDNAGALRSDYNEYDGMHISAPTYDIILSYTQRYIQETPEPEASSKHAPVSSPAVTTTSAPEENSTPDESSAPADSEPDSTSSLSEDYDKTFFADDLFIGDSISTGFSLYGVLDPKNVAAAVGYTPYKALNNAIDLGNGVTDTAYNYAVTMQPKRIFIMLGSNGITAAASMEESYRTLVEKLQANCPDSTVYILSVTPVTTDSSSAANAGIDNSMIRDFNKYLRDLASEKGVTYIDLYALLSDDNGYFLHEYAENDGLHFKGATYKVVLKYIEDTI